MKIFNLEYETHLSSCRKNVFAIVTIFIVILAIYSNTFNASWQFDDEPGILDREALHLTKLTWPQIRSTFFKAKGGNLYRPAACLSLALNYYFAKDSVFGYHVVNTSIHVFASVFLFLFIYQALNLPLLRARYGPNSYFVALLATVLWAINPVQTQAVTYIIQRMASMAGMFYIMAMYFYLRARTSDRRPLKAALFFICFVSALLAFASKENAAMLPISIFFFDVFLIQGLKKENIKRNSFIFLLLILIPLVLGTIFATPSIFSKDTFSGYEGRGFTLAERLLTQPRVILFYISLLLYPMPHRLCISHDISVSYSLINPPSTIIAILAILAIIVISAIISRRWPFISYCIFFFFLNHLIEASVFPLELIFEHRNYLPSMLFFAPIAIFFLRAIKSFSYKRSMQIVFTVFIIMLLVGWGHSTFMRNFIWKTQESLWLDAIDKDPNNVRTHHNLGRYYKNTGQDEKAIAEYELALKQSIDTHGEDRHLTHYNLALVYLGMDEQDKAINHFLKAVEIWPRFADAYNNLGIIMGKRGAYDDAFDFLIKSLTYKRDSPKAHNNLGYILIKRNQIEEAITEFKKALELKEDDKYALHNLGIAYKYRGDLDKAKQYFRSVLRKDSKALFTRLHLAETYFLMGKREIATRIISDTFDFLTPEEFYSKLKGFFEEDSFQELPDKDVILPLLGNAYLEKSVSLKKMGNELLEAIEKEEKMKE